MNSKIKISFGHSRAKNFDLTVKVARQFQGYREIDNRHEVTILPEEAYAKWSLFDVLVFNVRKWASAEIEYQGRILGPREIGPFFYSLLDIHRCFRSSHDDAKYCNHHEWGCNQIKDLHQFPNRWHARFWFNFGHFKAHKWVIDKVAVKRELLKEIEEKQLTRCPLFDMKRVQDNIDTLPDYIDLSKNKFFRATYVKRFVGDRIEPVPDNIEHVIPEPERQL